MVTSRGVTYARRSVHLNHLLKVSVVLQNYRSARHRQAERILQVHMSPDAVDAEPSAAASFASPRGVYPHRRIGEMEKLENLEKLDDIDPKLGIQKWTIST
ncbi:hypothetical protein WG66_013950 [Moniliophthora roreri]|nr:hypothetical protein WG66_013950 [Moniliophthora roreri]